MSRLALCLVLQEIGGPVDPGWGGGGIEHPGNRPPGSGAHPGGGPIFHPGHPDHGLPSGPPDHVSGGRPDRPDNSLPWGPNSPDNSLPVPPGVTPPATPGGALKDKLVVLWHLPGTTEWHGKVMDPSLSAGTPPTGAQPK